MESAATSASKHADTCKQFVQIFDEFLDNCKKVWSSDLELSKSSLALKSVVLGNPENEAKFVQRFYEALVAPVPEGIKVPYGKAFRDLTGVPITIFAVAQYHDYSRLFQACDSLEIQHVQVKFNKKYETATPGTRKVLSTVMVSLIDLACSLDPAPPEIPSREALASRVEERKRERAEQRMSEVNIGDAQVSMVCSAIAALEGVAPPEGIQAYSNLRGKTKDDATRAWANLSSAEVDAAIKSRDLGLLTAACDIDFLNVLDLGSLNGKDKGLDEFWSALRRTAGFGVVRDGIPAGVMSSIEEQARGVIEQIQSGGASLESLDINAIGEAVLQQCSAADMSELAANMPAMIPQLVALSTDMPGAPPGFGEVFGGGAAAAALSLN